MPDKQPSNAYTNELDSLLFSHGRMAEQIASQAQRLSEGPDLPWTMDQMLVISGATALTRPESDVDGAPAIHDIPARYRHQCQFVATIGTIVLWIVKTSDVRESSRWMLIHTFDDGTYEHGIATWIPT